jgi:hypothetical protein
MDRFPPNNTEPCQEARCTEGSAFHRANVMFFSLQFSSDMILPFGRKIDGSIKHDFAHPAAWMLSKIAFKNCSKDCSNNSQISAKIELHSHKTKTERPVSLFRTKLQ